jgi:hypothetical protein
MSSVGAVSRYRCLEDPGARVFAGHARAFLDRDPVGNNVLGTLLEAACVEERAGWRWVRVLDGDELVGVALHTPVLGVVLSSLPEPAAHALARHLTGTHAGFSRIDGPEAASAAVATHYAGLAGVTAREGERMRLLRLDAVRPPAGVAGRSRAATPADRDLVLGWLGGGIAEAVDRRLGYRDLMWFWEVDGAPVSFAWRTPPGRRARVTRIGAVYTVPEQRGRGYARANVAAVSAGGLAAGALACVLYADDGRLYEAVGYRAVGATREWRLS